MWRQQGWPNTADSVAKQTLNHSDKWVRLFKLLLQNILNFRKIRVIWPCKDPGSWQFRTFLCSAMLLCCVLSKWHYSHQLFQMEYCPFCRWNNDKKENNIFFNRHYFLFSSLLVKKLRNFNSWKHPFKPINKIYNSLFYAMHGFKYSTNVTATLRPK